MSPLQRGTAAKRQGVAQFPILIRVESNPSLCLSRGAGSRVPPRRVWLFLVLIRLDIRLLQVLCPIPSIRRDNANTFAGRASRPRSSSPLMRSLDSRPRGRAARRRHEGLSQAGFPPTSRSDVGSDHATDEIFTGNALGGRHRLQSRPFDDGQPHHGCFLVR